MIQRRLSVTTKVSILIVLVIFCFILHITIKNAIHILHRKEATGRVISYKAPDPKHPTTYLLETRFLNEYKQDSVTLTLKLNDHDGDIPNPIALYYDDSNEAYAANRERVTWGTVFWKSLVALLLLSYILLELTSFTISDGKKS